MTIAAATRASWGIASAIALLAGAGCGGPAVDAPKCHVPATSALPLPASARVIADKVESSDTPDNCFRNLLVVGAPELVAAERRALARGGWRLGEAANLEYGAYAPGDKAFVAFSTAERELEFERGGGAPWSETMGGRLRAAVRSGQPALAMRLQRG